MGRLVLAWLFAVGVAAAHAETSNLQRFEFTREEMAVPVKILLYATDESAATAAAEAAFARIHRLNSVLSDYDPDSELRRLSETAIRGMGVPVSVDLWRVLVHSQKLSSRSDGAFDVTVGPVVRLWRRARRREQLPVSERLKTAKALVGYDLLRLDKDSQSVELLRPGMRLDLGGIAKGYAIDEALGVLKKHGINRALIDAGGDMVLGDPPPGKNGWRIGVARLKVDTPPHCILVLANVAVATSGDAWQYVEIDGKRYSHIVDPRTGIGLTDHSSVTIVASTGMAADALASAVSVLGPEKGLKLIDETPKAAALIVRLPQQKVEIHQSNRWKDLPKAAMIEN